MFCECANTLGDFFGTLGLFRPKGENAMQDKPWTGQTSARLAVVRRRLCLLAKRLCVYVYVSLCGRKAPRSHRWALRTSSILTRGSLFRVVFHACSLYSLVVIRSAFGHSEFPPPLKSDLPVPRYVL